MAIARVNTTSAVQGSGTSSVSATAASATAGNLLYVFVKWENAVTITSVTDTAGNSFADCGAGKIDFTGGHIQCFVAKNIAGNASNAVAVNFSATADFVDVAVVQYSGCDTTAPVESFTSATGGAVTSLTSSSISTANADALILGQGMDGAAPATYTAGAIWATTATLVFSATLFADAEVEERLNVASGSGTGAISWNTTPTGCGIIFVALKPVSSSGALIPGTRTLLTGAGL